MRVLFLYLLLGLPALAMAQQKQVPEVDLAFLQRIKANTTDTIYVVNLWATWCKPCVEELPAFEELNRMFTGSRVKVLLISLDSKKNIDDRLIPFITQKNIRSTVLITDVVELNRHIDEVFPAWSGAIPATLISGNTKESKLFFEKSFTFEELKATIIPLMKKK